MLTNLQFFYRLTYLIFWMTGFLFEAITAALTSDGMLIFKTLDSISHYPIKQRYEKTWPEQIRRTETVKASS